MSGRRDADEGHGAAKYELHMIAGQVLGLEQQARGNVSVSARSVSEKTGMIERYYSCCSTYKPWQQKGDGVSEEGMRGKCLAFDLVELGLQTAASNARPLLVGAAGARHSKATPDI